MTDTEILDEVMRAVDAYGTQLEAADPEDFVQIMLATIVFASTLNTLMDLRQESD